MTSPEPLQGGERVVEALNRARRALESIRSQTIPNGDARTCARRTEYPDIEAVLSYCQREAIAGLVETEDVAEDDWGHSAALASQHPDRERE